MNARQRIRGRRWLFTPAALFIGVMLVAALVAKPSALGWIGLLVVATVALLIGAVAATLYPGTRANAVRVHPRAQDSQRLLVLVNTDRPSAGLCAVVKRRVADGGEVLVVAPVLASP